MRRKSHIRAEIVQLPLFLLIFGVFAASMIIPAFYAVVTRDLLASRAFLYSSLLGILIFTLIAIAHSGRKARHGALGPLMSLFSSFVFLPAILAVPFLEALPTTRFLNVYFDMVSSITTTGASMFDDPGRLSDTLHLWRAQVAWMGGLLMWIAASAILAPLHLGGFEVTAQAEPGNPDARRSTTGPINPRVRLLRTASTLAPIYISLTLLLWLLLLANGDRSLVALCHAMSVMATSGISPLGGTHDTGVGIGAEVVMVLFMLFSLSRLTFSKDTVTATQGGLWTDPEFRMGLALIIGVQ